MSQVTLGDQGTLIPNELDFWREVNWGMKNALCWPQAPTEGLRDRCSGWVVGSGGPCRQTGVRRREKHGLEDVPVQEPVSHPSSHARRAAQHTALVSGLGEASGGGAQGGRQDTHGTDCSLQGWGVFPPALFPAPPIPTLVLCTHSALFQRCTCVVWWPVLHGAPALQGPGEGWQAQCLPPRQSVCLHDSPAALCAMG